VVRDAIKSDDSARVTGNVVLQSSLVPGSRLRTAVSLILNTRHPMWIGWGKDATFLYNDAYVDVLGAAKHPWALGRPASEVWSEIWDVCGPLADKVFQRAEATFVEAVQLFMRRGDFLEETWYSFSYSPIVGEDGGVGGLFCPSTDVSASVLNARRLGTLSRLSADALREPTVAGACATGIGTLADNPADLPFVLLYLTDCDGKEMLHLGGTAGLPASIDAGRFPVARACRDGEALPVDLDGIAGLPAGLSGQPLRQALVLPLATAGHERPLGALVLGVSPVRRLDAEYRTFFDLLSAQVTAALQNAGAIEEQRRRVDTLAELDRAKTAFFSNVSHEFRTPLTLMLGPIEHSLADADEPLPAAQRDRLQLVRRNALRLERLVNTLLDFSRVQAGRMQANFTLADLPALTADLASGFRSVIESAGLVFDVRCTPLPRPVRLDVVLWEKIVLNLLSNAFKFTFEGTIAVTVDAVDGAARVTVRDTGIGIAPGHLGAVFERFQRVEGARSRSNEGSGIGLALVRDLVELQGGVIAVDSTPGRGSAFIVTLPPPGSPAPRPAEEPVVLSMARVLVADDNADMRDYLARLLGQHWEVSVAADGVEALAMVRRERPDVVVAHVMMPRLDGFGLIARLRADRELADTPPSSCPRGRARKRASRAWKRARTTTSSSRSARANSSRASSRR